MKENVLIYNFGQHYREAIFKKMDIELGFDFYFGDNSMDIKTFNYEKLKGYKGILKHKKLYKVIYWQKGLLSLAFKKYNKYILLGEYFCVTHWILFVILKLQNKKIIIWTHGWYGNEGFFKKIVKKIYFSFADKILLYGDYAKNLMIKEGFPIEKLEVIYNSLDVDKQNYIYRGIVKSNIFYSYFQNKNKVLLYIGRLQKRKKIEQIIHALEILRHKDIYLNLVLIGGGEMEKELKELVNVMGLNSQIWFYGPTYKEEEIAKLIFNADLCVSPGNVGLTAMHSLVYGTPVITHSDFKNQMPEFEAILPGISGDFFEEDSLDDLSLKMAIWVEKDKNLISDNCRKIIFEKYNPDYQIEVIKKALNEVM